MNARDPRAEIRQVDTRHILPHSVVPSNDPRATPNKENFNEINAQFPRSFNPGQPPPTLILSTASTQGSTQQIPVMTSSRNNLISVPLHEPPADSPSFPAVHSTPSFPPPHPPPQSHIRPRSMAPLTPLPHSVSPLHPFSSPPPISHSQPPIPPPHFQVAVTSSFSFPPNQQPQSAQYSFRPPVSTSQSPLVPSPFASAPPPPVPVPPPGQFTNNQWSTPPPRQPLRPVTRHPITLPPPPSATLPRHPHISPSNPPLRGVYYR